MIWNQLAPLDPGLTRRWEALSGGAAGLGDLDRIRRAHGADMARFVSLQVELRRRVRGRLDVDALPFLTTKGAEQATPGAVARYRAARFARCRADALVWDACVGIGSDLVALAEYFDRLVATDSDAPTLRCAVANIAHGMDRTAGTGAGDSRRPLPIVAAVADAARPPLREIPLSAGGPILGLFDPDRRPGGRREARPEHWMPPLDRLFAVASELTGACFKLSPSVPLEAVQQIGIPAGAEAAWISLDGEMKELSLWTGELAGDDCTGGAHRAIALRTSGTEASYLGSPHARILEATAAEAVQAGWLVELDVSLQMADLTGSFADEFDLAALEDGGPGGYLICRGPVAHPLARSFQILGSTAADRKRVRAMLRDHDVGKLVVKTHGHPEPAERLARAFQGTGSREGLLMVTRVGGRAVAFLVERARKSTLPASQDDPGGR